MGMEDWTEVSGRKGRERGRKWSEDESLVGTPSWRWVIGEISSDEGSAVVWKKIAREEY